MFQRMTPTTNYYHINTNDESHVFGVSTLIKLVRKELL